MRIAVVGAGFTGCLAALHASRAADEVVLFESSPQLGGILRDVEVNGRRYFNNCQYLRPSSLSCVELTQQMHVFPHEYGSLTLLGNREARLLDDCAQPALDGFAELDPDAVLDCSALERLAAYGPHATSLIAWASGFGKLDELDQSCLLPMQLSRIYYPEDPSLEVKKSSDSLADKLIALPRRIRLPGHGAEAGMLPPNGFNPFFDEIARVLRSSGVRLCVNSSVKLMGDSASVRLSSQGVELSCDKVVWAANPTALLKRHCRVDLRTAPIRMALIVGDFHPDASWASPVPLPYYWQVFDHASPVVRVYVYQLQNCLRFSVEAFDRPDLRDHRQTLGVVFAKLGLPANFNVAVRLSQLRHVNFSPIEFAAIQASSQTLLERGIIPGGWCHYGRDQKLESIRALLNDLFA